MLAAKIQLPKKKKQGAIFVPTPSVIRLPTWIFAMRVANSSEALALQHARPLESLLSMNCTESENGRWDVPNAATIAAIEELERGGGKTFNSIEELMAELND